MFDEVEELGVSKMRVKLVMGDVIAALSLLLLSFYGTREVWQFLPLARLVILQLFTNVNALVL